MKIEIQYFGTCPNWRTALERAREAVARAGVDAEIVAVERENAASPTFLIGGRDPFPGHAEAASCRLYATPDGPQGSPTIEQLVEAIHSYMP